MNDLEFRRQVLDTKSSSFCAAKWYNATIWLGSGQTTSCHHPPAHSIDVDALATNPSAIHNTEQKKLDRQQMQSGERPPGCEYCWKIEDMGVDAVSDRVYKSKIYPIESLNDAYNLDYRSDVNLRTLEIAFDRTCQFACSYCNPAFSSTWVKDIKNNGPYTRLTSDGRNHFTHIHSDSQRYVFGDDNPYVTAFFKWWESDLHKSLQELRITGGEPLMSGETWRLIDWFKTNQGKSKTRLAINTNLGYDDQKLDEFLTAIKDLPHIEIYTSNESTDQQAEYIRDGLDFAQWTRNLNRLVVNPSVKAVHVMATINALCLDSLPDFLEQILRLKLIYGNDAISFTLNILRFPSFQSPLILPDELRNKYRIRLINFLKRHEEYHNKFHEHEVNHIQRLIDYLDLVKTPHSEAFDRANLLNDFKQFYTQYDQRRNKNFVDTFPNLADWYMSL